MWVRKRLNQVNCREISSARSRGEVTRFLPRGDNWTSQGSTYKNPLSKQRVSCCAYPPPRLLGHHTTAHTAVRSTYSVPGMLTPSVEGCREGDISLGLSSPAARVLLRRLPELRRGVVVKVFAPRLDGVLHLQEVVLDFHLQRMK